MIGSTSPGSQFQIVRPMAASRAIAVSAGTSTVCTKRPRSSPTMRTTTEPPIVAISGESPL
jgi:hypothetical protein